MQHSTAFRAPLALAALGLAAATIATAIEPPTHRSFQDLLFRVPEMTVSANVRRASELGEAIDAGSLARLGVTAETALVETGTGRFVALFPATPVLPGRGIGNALAWSELGTAVPRGPKELEQAAWATLHAYFVTHAAELRIDPAELVIPAQVTAVSDELVHVVVGRQVDGVPVRDSRILATIKFGNLILLGVEKWADVSADRLARYGAAEAEEALRRFVGERDFGRTLRAATLVWIPVDGVAGLDYRLAWSLWNDLREDGGKFEGLVDAKSGEVLALEDQLHWAATPRRVVGGVYPVSNDQTPPDGVEQAGWPMPYSRVTVGAQTVVTDVGGNLESCVDGSITAVLSGPYVDMIDICGAESLAGTGDIDWLSGPTAGATDCTTPGVGGAGNTKASRTGFHELNMVKLMGRSHLPANTWLQGQLPATMNINNTCNANWNGVGVNFYRKGASTCGNTGEIAGIFDHEWGHGMDANDSVPGIANPGEAVADMYANLRLDDSCVGRGFRATNCGGYGNPCTACTGVRDVDWAKRNANTPTTVTWIDANCGSGPAPCGGGVHCEGSVAAESVWDLWNRKLTAGSYNYSLDLAREIATQLTYRGATAVTSWFTCNQGSGGCGAGNGYLNYLAADDDDGNLLNGTPHMTGIHAAFSDHGIACATPTVQDSGCAGAPAVAPVVVATPAGKAVLLSWGTVPGATSYRIYRTDGVFGCAFGKVLIGTVTGTSYVDGGLQNGRSYSYLVLPMGANDACFGVPSSCTAATPTAAAGALALSAATSAITPAVGDDDPFVDNCELSRVRVPFSNSGGGALTNVRILGATSPSHPSTTFVTSFPKTVAASLASCESGTAQVDFVPEGLAPGDTIEIVVEITHDQLGGLPIPVQVSYGGTEGDLQFEATRTFNFESDTEGWQTTSGTFVRANAIAGPTGGGSFYYQSSANLDNRCDVVQSPIFRLTPTSTLALQNHFVIENFSGSQWWDRANVGVVDLGAGTRTLVSPSSGRTYNASGTGGNCGTEGQGGWAGSAATWAASNWTSGALQTGALAGRLARLEVRYGTDESVNGSGFRFDLVTLTDIEMSIPDSSGDVCVASHFIFADDFESAGTAAWSQAVGS